MTDSEYVEVQRKATAEAVEKSRAADDLVLAVRDGRATFTPATAFTVLAALAAGRVAMRERQELRAINADLRADIKTLSAALWAAAGALDDATATNAADWFERLTAAQDAAHAVLRGVRHDP